MAAKPTVGDLFNVLSDVCLHVGGETIGDSVIHNPDNNSFEIHIPAGTQEAIIGDLIEQLTESFESGAPVSGVIGRQEEGGTIILSIPVNNMNLAELRKLDKQLKPGEGTDVAEVRLTGLRAIDESHLTLLAGMDFGKAMPRVTDGVWRLMRELAEEGTRLMVPGRAHITLKFPNTISNDLKDNIKGLPAHLNIVAGGSLDGKTKGSALFELGTAWAHNIDKSVPTSVGIRSYSLVVTQIDPDLFPNHLPNLKDVVAKYAELYQKAAVAAVASIAPVKELPPGRSRYPIGWVPPPGGGRTT